ncbi:MAG: hypothetical protein JWP42_4012 [Pseudomonas sp.]|nr:hypothetical protein [Pseudomonas sp.]
MNNLKDVQSHQESLLSAFQQVTQSFFEADQLDEAAYAILNDCPLTCSTFDRFSAAKKLANDKYLAARQEWLRLKEIQDANGKKIKPKNLTVETQGV